METLATPGGNLVCVTGINAAAALAHRIDSRSIRVRSKGLTLSAPAVHVELSLAHDREADAEDMKFISCLLFILWKQSLLVATD
jgi:hypothetical protein